LYRTAAQKKSFFTHQAKDKQLLART